MKRNANPEFVSQDMQGWKREREREREREWDRDLARFSYNVI